MNLEHFARLFRLQYQPQPRELPPQPYFPNGIGYGAHRVPHSELPPMGGLPDNMGVRWAGSTAISASAGWTTATVSCRCWTACWYGWNTRN